MSSLNYAQPPRSAAALLARRGRCTPSWILLCLLPLAGCGGSFHDSSGALQVHPGAHAVRTGEQLRLLADTGEDAAPVRWRITASNNAPALGAGSISADGIYTPPSMLSRDVVTVAITAGVADAAADAATVTTTLSVVPGFVQPLQPENATLPPGSSIQVRAQLAEVGSGSVSWSLASANSGEGTAAELGTLGGQHCDHGPQQFTSCTVTYTAPATPTTGALIWLVASTHKAATLPEASVRARLAVGEITSNPALHQVEQAGPIALGGSGGSDNDFDTYKDHAGTRYVADCCGGTLGALVEDQSGTPYLLSNNHVLATSDQGRAGDTIEQPGLIDDGCVPLSQAGSRMQSVGSLRYALPLNAPNTNVDAALATVHPGAVDPNGSILEFGAELGAEVGAKGAGSGSPTSLGEMTLRSAPPVAGTGEVLDASRLNGLEVVKSGRTTGLTCSTVDAVDLRVAVDYYKDCAESEPYTSKIFTGQIGIGGDSFADSGDSGALVVDASNARAIGLLYATATADTPAMDGAGVGLTLANPIGEVLNELAGQVGSPLTLRGTATPHSVACLHYDAPLTRPAFGSLSLDERARTAAAVEAAATLRSARVLAVAPGTSADEPGRGAVLVFVDRSQAPVPVPRTIGGLRTVLVPSDPETITRGPSAWPAAPVKAGVHLSASALAAAKSTAERLGPELMRTPGIFGVGVTQSLDDPDEPALLVLLEGDASRIAVDRSLQSLAEPAEAAGSGLPATLAGMRVRYQTMHRLRVTQSKYVARGAASSCKLRLLAQPAE